MSVRRNPVLWRASVAGAVTGLTVLATAAPGFACQSGGQGQSAKSDSHASRSHANRSYHAEANSSAKQDQNSSEQSKNSSDEHPANGSDEQGQGKGSEGKGSQGNGSEGNGSEAAPANGSQGANGTEGHNPPGNNGTVFIHDVPGDHYPHNVPHVGCTFYVDFFGFDKDQAVTMSFAGQAPTGKGVPLGGGWSGTVSNDDAGGAGNDFDYEVAVNSASMGLEKLGAPAKQGYHVKLTVATGEPGGAKYKVFWIQPCTSTVAALPTESPTPVPTVPATGGAVLGGSQSKPAAGAPAAKTGVLGETFTNAGSTGARGTTSGGTGAVEATGASLPFTGAAHLTEMALGAAGLLAGGAGLMVAGRRRRRGSHAA